MRCGATTGAGLPCFHPVTGARKLCKWHDPARKAERTAMASRGASAVNGHADELRKPVIDRLRTLEDVHRAFEKAAAMVSRRSDPDAARRAQVLIQAGREARELIKVRDLERRLAALEGANDDAERKA